MNRVNLDAILFADGSPTYFLLSEWRNREPLIPLQPTLLALEEDRRPTPLFRSAWRTAFPDRGPLPDEPLADEDGRGTQALWDVMR
jgi:hypothetical protein